MDQRTAKFLVFCVFGVLSLMSGYMARRRGWLGEKTSRRLHYHTLVWIWTASTMLGLWTRPLIAADIWLALMQTAIVAGLAGAAIFAGRLARLNRSQTAVLAVASAVHNNGFTLGSYLCFSLLANGQAAFSITVFMVTIMQVAAVLVLFPLARAYGPHAGDDKTTGRLILENFVDLRSLALYAAVIGAVLAWRRVPVPDFIDRWHILDIFFYIGSFSSYFGIGLILRFGKLVEHIKPLGILCAMKFLLIPALTLAMLAAAQASPWPVDKLVWQVVLIEAFMPTAIMTVIIANLFRLDVELAGSLWMWNTVVFVAVVLPPMIFLLR